MPGINLLKDPAGAPYLDQIVNDLGAAEVAEKISDMLEGVFQAGALRGWAPLGQTSTSPPLPGAEAAEAARTAASRTAAADREASAAVREAKAAERRAERRAVDAERMAEAMVAGDFEAAKVALRAQYAHLKCPSLSSRYTDELKALQASFQDGRQPSAPQPASLQPPQSASSKPPAPQPASSQPAPRFEIGGRVKALCQPFEQIADFPDVYFSGTVMDCESGGYRIEFDDQDDDVLQGGDLVACSTGVLFDVCISWTLDQLDPCLDSRPLRLSPLFVPLPGLLQHRPQPPDSSSHSREMLVPGWHHSASMTARTRHTSSSSMRSTAKNQKS